MRKILPWILFATPLFYVGLMKATSQPVEYSVLLMLVPFIAAPFVLAHFMPEDEEEAKEGVMNVIKAAARGGRPGPQPKRNDGKRRR